MRAPGHMQPEMTLLVKLPIRLIEEKFGAGNFDEAGDAVLGVLSSLGMRTRCTVQWNFDTAHPNPWYHTMNLSLRGLPDSESASLREEIQRLGISED